MIPLLNNSAAPFHRSDLTRSRVVSRNCLLRGVLSLAWTTQQRVLIRASLKAVVGGRRARFSGTRGHPNLSARGEQSCTFVRMFWTMKFMCFTLLFTLLFFYLRYCLFICTVINIPTFYINKLWINWNEQIDRQIYTMLFGISSHLHLRRFDTPYVVAWYNVHNVSIKIFNRWVIFHNIVQLQFDIF